MDVPTTELTQKCDAWTSLSPKSVNHASRFPSRSSMRRRLRSTPSSFTAKEMKFDRAIHVSDA